MFVGAKLCVKLSNWYLSFCIRLCILQLGNNIFRQNFT